MTTTWRASSNFSQESGEDRERNSNSAPIAQHDAEGHTRARRIWGMRGGGSVGVLYSALSKRNKTQKLHPLFMIGPTRPPALLYDGLSPQLSMGRPKR